MKEKRQSKTKDIVLITGANGHLAKVVGKQLSKYYSVRYLTTKKTSNSKGAYFYWDIKEDYIDTKALESCNHIIHLAGLSILKKWTKKNKEIMYNSRVKGADLIFDTCNAMNIKPKTFISASAIGIYDQSIKEKTHEDSIKGNNWIANMASDWENSANKFKAIGSRVVQMRISLIFSKQAGFLKYNILSMRFGLGAIIGNKLRKIHWIHVKDLARFIKESIQNKSYNGPFNLACDNNSSQEDLIKSIRRNIFPYAIIIRIPITLVKLFIGERTQIIETNLSIGTEKIKKHGFKCKINTLDEMLNA